MHPSRQMRSIRRAACVAVTSGHQSLMTYLVVGRARSAVVAAFRTRCGTLERWLLVWSGLKALPKELSSGLRLVACSVATSGLPIRQRSLPVAVVRNAEATHGSRKSGHARDVQTISASGCIRTSGTSERLRRESSGSNRLPHQKRRLARGALLAGMSGVRSRRTSTRGLVAQNARAERCAVVGEESHGRSGSRGRLL